MKGSITTDRELCKGCGICIEFCDKKVLAFDAKVNLAGYIPVKFINNGGCNGCGVCAIVCPDVAIEVYRE
jgi:2-oxoglutarate ferredoxin oxidoreductase subunit delta